MKTIGTLTNGQGTIFAIVKISDDEYHAIPNHKLSEHQSTATANKMDKAIEQLHSYEVTIKPDGATDENGLRTIRLKARDGYDAMERAAWATGRPVFNAVRIDR